jgi:phosphoglycolate phosphatase
LDKTNNLSSKPARTKVKSQKKIILITIVCKDRVFNNIEAIIFDKDGTLEDSQAYWSNIGKLRSQLIDSQIPGIFQSLVMIFGIQGNNLDPTGLMAVGSRYENEIAAAACIAKTGISWLEAKEIARSAFEATDRHTSDTPKTSPLFAGSLEVIKYLANAGLKLGILSADSTANVKVFVKYHQLSDYFQLSMGSDRDLTKPDPKLFIRACQNLGVKPSATLMVGDSQGDLEMAKRAGSAGAIGICWGNAFATHLKLADLAISQLKDIKIQLS